jgi:hypothetical protein
MVGFISHSIGYRLLSPDDGGIGPQAFQVGDRSVLVGPPHKDLNYQNIQVNTTGACSIHLIVIEVYLPSQFP